MIASYAWGQDAPCLGALIGKDEVQLITIILEGIARLHQVPIKTLSYPTLSYPIQGGIVLLERMRGRGRVNPPPRRPFHGASN
jgi:hypothetical protein